MTNIEKIDEPLLLWLSSSQWLGGLLFLIADEMTAIVACFKFFLEINLIIFNSEYNKVDL